MAYRATVLLFCVTTSVSLTFAACTFTPAVRAPANTVGANTPAPTPTPVRRVFDGATAYKHVETQVALGPRHPGTLGNRRLGDAIIMHLAAHGWQTQTQEFDYRGTRIRNVWGIKGRGDIAIIGAHYDTRKFADQDAKDKTQPVPGANDGASGVAVLMELAATLDMDAADKQVWLAFFDAEDNGDIEGWEWIVGSSHMAQTLTVSPTAVIVLDMIGDVNQEIFIERTGDGQLSNQLWSIARQLGYEQQFRMLPKWSMIDDHTPFLRRGFRAVDIIDFDYPHWHTLQDTPDKVSSASLERVGRVVKTWVEMK
jgi:hypothetical protein